jgi:hypothetical protein
MRLQLLGTNRTLVTFNNGTEIFFSYETPVAGRLNGEYFRTVQKYSVTTSKHIGQYIGGHYCTLVTQEYIEDLLESNHEHAH